MESIHGHEVMHMMIGADKLYTKDSLTADIATKFGADARFHTCSASDLTGPELIELLEKKGKFTFTDSGFHTNPDRVCNH